mgnify:CR=1 FL=1
MGKFIIRKGEMLMKINLKGKNLNITDDMRDNADKKFSRLDKYFENEENLDLKISEEGNNQVVEATINLINGPILRAEAGDESYLNAMDKVIDALLRQVRKHKTRLKRDRNNTSIKFENLEEDFNADYQTEISELDSINIDRIKEIPVKPMSAEEAILQMELLNHNFFVYEDMDDGGTCVVYKRNKGGYGKIIPRL